MGRPKGEEPPWGEPPGERVLIYNHKVFWGKKLVAPPPKRGSWKKRRVSRGFGGVGF